MEKELRELVAKWRGKPGRLSSAPAISAAYFAFAECADELEAALAEKPLFPLGEGQLKRIADKIRPQVENELKVPFSVSAETQVLRVLTAFKQDLERCPHDHPAKGMTCGPECAEKPAERPADAIQARDRQWCSELAKHDIAAVAAYPGEISIERAERPQLSACVEGRPPVKEKTVVTYTSGELDARDAAIRREAEQAGENRVLEMLSAELAEDVGRTLKAARALASQPDARKGEVA